MAEPVRSEVEVVATDFGFEVDPAAIPAGEVRTTLSNAGKAPHQMGYYMLRDGVTYERFVTAILRDDSNLPRLALGGRAGVMRPVNGGDRYVRPSDVLEKGTYALVCSIRDPETGKNHYELGMVAPFEVE